MIDVSGYLRPDYTCLSCEVKPISVNSAGYFHFKTRDVGSMIRSKGREDYQMIYVAKGKGYFTFEQEEVTVEEGRIVIYRPGQMQMYRYDYRDQSQIYWIHFTGNRVEEYLAEYQLGEKSIYQIGFTNEIIQLWENIITELQIKRIYYEELTTGLLLQLLAGLSRTRYEEKNNVPATHKAIQEIIAQIHRSEDHTLMIKEYAEKCNMSVCWFISCFKELTGMTPGQYMTHIKMSKAKSLLTDTQLNISEVADLLGFKSAFYFSKTFKKVTGVTPRDWKG